MSYYQNYQPTPIDAKSYGMSSRRRQTCGSTKCFLIGISLVGILIAVAASVGGTMYINSNKMYRDHLLVRQKIYDQDYVLYHSDICSSEHIRLQVGEHGKCKEWKQTISVKPEDAAMVDWLEDMTLCRPGECFVTSFTLSTLITQVVPAISFFTIAVLGLIAFCLWDKCLRRDERDDEIPLMISRLVIEQLTNHRSKETKLD